MTGPPELPPGIPPDRVWLPVAGPDSAEALLHRLYMALRERPAPTGAGEADQV